MDDYISREAAIKAAKCHYPKANEMIAGIILVPTADVRPVVFCKDCEFLKVGKVSMTCAKGILSFIYQSDYCSRGKRRTYNGE